MTWCLPLLHQLPNHSLLHYTKFNGLSICRVLRITFHQSKRVESLIQEVCPPCISKTEHFQLFSQLPDISSNLEKFYKTLERKKKQFHSVWSVKTNSLGKKFQTHISSGNYSIYPAWHLSVALHNIASVPDPLRETQFCKYSETREG